MKKTKKKRNNKFKQGEAIVFDPNWKSEDYANEGVRRGDLCYYLTDIPNVPGHCIVIHSVDGSVIPMYHPEDFRKAKDEEL